MNDSESYLCDETMDPYSPLTNPSTGSDGLSSPAAVPRSRTVYIKNAAMALDFRRLSLMLQEEKVSINLLAWGSSLRKRRQHWIKALVVFLEGEFSHASLQLAILLVDRFRSKFRGNLDEEPLDLIFNAALIVVEQIVNDNPEEILVPYLERISEKCGKPRRTAEDFQVMVRRILEITQWEIIESTAASFVPYFLEAANLRQLLDTALQDQILTVSTLFMIEEHIAGQLKQSEIAAMAIVLQLWLILKNNNFHHFAHSGLASSDFFKTTVDSLIRTAKIKPERFAHVVDVAVTKMLVAEWIDALTPQIAQEFVDEMRNILKTIINRPLHYSGEIIGEGFRHVSIG